MLKLGALVGVLATFSIGCRGGSGEATSPINVTTCGVPYTFSIPPHRSIVSGSCAGLLAPVAPAVVIHRGIRFSVAIAREQSGALDFPVPASSGAAVRLVSHVGARATYQAASAGTTKLVAHHARFCGSRDPRIGSCAVLKVHVES